MRIRALKLILASALCVLAAGSAAEAAVSRTLQVTLTTDTDQNGTGNCATGGSCSLREAVNQANSDATGDTIEISPGTYTLDTNFGPLTLNADAELVGAGAGPTVISGNSGTEILDVESPATVTATGLTLEDGDSTNRGGAVLVNPDATLTLSNATVSGSTAVYGGGGIEDQGTLTLSDDTLSGNDTSSEGSGGALELVTFASDAAGATVTDSTFSGNDAAAYGGAIFVQSNVGGGAVSGSISGSTFTDNFAGGAEGAGGGGIADIGQDGTLQVSDTTIAGNSTATNGGGVLVGGAGVAFVNDTIADNSATSGNGGDFTVADSNSPTLENTIVAAGTAATDPDCGGSPTLVSLGHNLDQQDNCGFDGPGDLVDTNPDLGALANNGGTTETLALEPGSPAINAGSNSGCPATDQRGISRPQGGTCDIGAYESAPMVAGAESAGGLSQTGATLTGSVSNPDLFPGTVAFEYGPTTSYGDTAASSAEPSSAGATSFSAALTGLQPGTTYHYRVVAINPDGTAYGADQTFTTTAAPAGPPPSNAFTASKLKVSDKGVLSTMLTAPDAGTFTTKATFTVTRTVTTHEHGKKIRKRVRSTHNYGTATVTITAAGEKVVKINLSKSAARELKSLGHARVTVAITFAPVGGTAAAKKPTVTVKVGKTGRYS